MKFKKITLENFRCFKGTHEIEFSPITLLFGGNGVGKTSVSKAIRGFYSLSCDDIFYGQHNVKVGLNFDNTQVSIGIADKASIKQIVNYFFDDKTANKIFLNFKAHNLNIFSKSELIELLIKDIEFFIKKVNEITLIHEVALNQRGDISSTYVVNNESMISINKNSGNDGPYCFFNYEHPIFEDCVSVRDAFEQFQIFIETLKDRFDLDEFFSKIQLYAIQDSHLMSSFVLNHLGLAESNIQGEYDNNYRFFFAGSLVTSLIIMQKLFGGVRTFCKLNHLGPLRKVPTVISFTEDGSDSKIIHHLTSSSKDDFDGDSSWKFLANAKRDKKSSDAFQVYFAVNDWLLNWFDTPYKLTFIDNFNLRVSSEDVLNRLKNNKIKESDLQLVNREIKFINMFNGSETDAKDIGVGISQLTPVIVNSLTCPQFSVEQPELHIHPKMQTTVADLFIFTGLYSRTDDSKKAHVILELPNKNSGTVEIGFTRKDRVGLRIIETHSEHLMLRLLKRVREGFLEPEEISVNVITSNEGCSKVVKIKVDKDGDFESEWPDGFFDERDEELF